MVTLRGYISQDLGLDRVNQSLCQQAGRPVPSHSSRNGFSYSSPSSK
jgi:hypothetical protein